MIVITVARKPLSEPTVAANVLKHGTGAINIDSANECWVSIGSGSTMYRVTRERMESAKKIAADW